jgi:hypothetical protein
VAENGDFRQGSHYPWVILGGGWINLSVTGNGGPCQNDPGGEAPRPRPPPPSFTGVILALRVTGDLPLATQRRVESIASDRLPLRRRLTASISLVCG